MFQNIKSIFARFKDQGAVGLSNVIDAGIRGIFWFTLATFLEKSDYGELGYLMSIGMIGASVANLGLSQTITVFGAKKEQIYFSAFVLGMISSLITSFVVYLLIQNIAVSFLIWGAMTFGLLMAELNGLKKYVSLSLFTIIRSITTIAFALILYDVLGIDGVIWGYFIATLPGIIGIMHFIKTKRTSFALIKTKFVFMLNAHLSYLTSILFWWGDKIIVAYMFGFSILGGYQLASQYFLFLNAIPAALMIYLLPQEAEGKSNKKTKIYSIIFSIIIVIISILALPTIIVNVLPEFSDSTYIMQIMTIAIIPTTVFIILESSFLGKEKSNLLLISSIIQIITYFVSIVILGTEYGIVGVAIAFLISNCVRAMIDFTLYKKIRV